MNDIRGQVRELSPAQRERLLAMLGEIRPGERPRTADFRRRPASSGPLSFAQQRLWFLQQMYPEAAAYNCPLLVRINQRLDAEVLARALSELARRHEILRTTFSLESGRPLQLVNPPAPVPLRRIDLCHVSAAERDGAAAAAIREEGRQPFDLLSGPCWRASLLKLEDERYILEVIFHHIITDGWSIALFQKELAAVYEAFAQGRPSPLAEPPLQYLDFAAGQRDWLQSEALQSQLAYWREHLAGAPPVLDLPADRPRPAAQSFRGANQLFRLPESLSGQLRELSRREGVTMFMTLLAAFKTLLYRYTGQADILVGTPIANRNHCDVEGLLGVFVNTLVLRTKLSGRLSFRELLGSVRDTCLGAYAHQDLPFERLVEELRPERDPRHTPIFQTMFVLQNIPRGPREASAWSPMGLAMESGSAQFDLGLNVEDRGRELVGAFEYSTDIFEHATITRLVENFETLLRAVVADPGERVAYLPLLAPGSRRLVLRDWNDTAAARPEGQYVADLFEARAARSPDAAAVADAGGRLTYGELNRRANRIAHRLRRAGVAPESVVAVYMRRSADFVAALLGVLKAGAAYLPLDPTQARARLDYMLKDAGARVLLTNDDPDLDAPGDGEALSLDLGGLEGEEATNPARDLDGENLAYVLYTSGSTGKPKGVLVRQRSLLNHGLAMGELYQLRPGDRVLQFAPLGFDVAAEELFPTLLSGATVVPRPEELLSPADFLKYAAHQSITVVNLPSSYWHEVVFELSRRGAQLPASVRLMVVGSEQVSAERLAEWMNLPGARPRLINAYGPTEATISATTYVCEAARADTRFQTTPVGRPLPNVQVYVLDPHLQPVPPGAQGELCIGGDGLARGYLYQPALTAEKFVPHPFARRPGLRLYRTGDLARHLPDGNIELIGRTDGQVKVRGFRVELGEIESVLSQSPLVREAVVLFAPPARFHAAAEAAPEVKALSPSAEPAGGSDAAPRLLAFVTPAVGQSVSAGDLREFLRDRLPDYMVPAEFAVLDELPVSASGKVDRRALLEAGAAARPAAPRALPRDELERAIAGFWREALGTEEVGRDDNFFDLGGHSLLLIQVNRMLKDYCRREIPVVEMFRHPTVATLAAFVGGPAGGPEADAFEKERGRAAIRREAGRQQRALRQEHRASAKQ
ncbi:MAG TPA: amino acid adenylation domain-containing protein [Pyrinomonadaceae bacterium]|jgi:amino acid adenylation domain-containing protein